MIWSSIPRTHTKKSALLSLTCGPSAWGVETGRFWGATAASLALLVTPRPVKNPVSKSKVDGT